MEIREKVRKTLGSFMQEFTNGNQGNRLSRELLAGLGGFLEDFIITLCKETEKEFVEKLNEGNKNDSHNN